MCRLLGLGIIKAHIEAIGYSDYLLNKSKFKLTNDKEKKNRGRKPKVKNQIDLMLEQSVNSSQTISSPPTNPVYQIIPAYKLNPTH
jgi:hypothetical protein